MNKFINYSLIYLFIGNLHIFAIVEYCGFSSETTSHKHSFRVKFLCNRKRELNIQKIKNSLIIPTYLPSNLHQKI